MKVLKVFAVFPHAVYRKYLATGKTQVSYEEMKEFCDCIGRKINPNKNMVYFHLCPSEINAYLSYSAAFIEEYYENGLDKPVGLKIKNYAGSTDQEFYKYLDDKLQISLFSKFGLDFLADKNFGQEVFEKQNEGERG